MELLENNINLNSIRLNFNKIYELKFKDYGLYKKFFILLNSNELDILNYIELIYIAYKINCLEDISFKQFLSYIQKFSFIQIVNIYFNLYGIKEGNSFRKAFKVENIVKRVKIPKFQFEDVEDYFTYYCLILNISEETFWKVDLSFLLSISENKSRFDAYVNKMKSQVIEEKR